jgi:hypothetical protein
MIQNKRYKLKYGAGDRLLPRDFFEVLGNRYAPVCALTYLASIVGIAMEKAHTGGFVHQLAMNTQVHLLAMLVAIWVSVPAFLWIIVKGSIRYYDYANACYGLVAGVMALTLVLSMFLFPLKGPDILRDVRMFIVASLPIHVIMYVLFVRGGMPPNYTAPLSIAGGVAFVYGLVLIFV